MLNHPVQLSVSCVATGRGLYVLVLRHYSFMHFCMRREINVFNLQEILLVAKELESLCFWGTPLSCTCLSTDGSHKEKKGLRSKNPQLYVHYY